MSNPEYPFFVTDTNRHTWEELSAERDQQHLNALPYILKK